MSAHESIFNNGRFQQLALPQVQQKYAGQAGQTLSQFDDLGYAAQFERPTVDFDFQTADGLTSRFSGPTSQTAAGSLRFDEFFSTMAASGSQRMGSEVGVAGAATVWVSPITTGDDGKAQVNVQLPESVGQWNLSAKGCTTDTLVGQASTQVITRKDFLVELRTPEVLQEGDTMEWLATVHNLTDFEGDATITLTVSGASQPFSTRKTVRIKKQSPSEIVLDGYTIPFTESLHLEIKATAGKYTDRSEMDLRVRPWGLEYAAHAGGVTSTEAGATLTLPKQQTYSGRKLHITLSPSIEQAIIDLALERGRPLFGADCVYPPAPQTQGSALLAATSALHYARRRARRPGKSPT